MATGWSEMLGGGWTGGQEKKKQKKTDTATLCFTAEKEAAREAPLSESDF